MTYPVGQPRPLAYITARSIAIDEPGNYSYKAIPVGTILYRYTGNTYSTNPLPTGVMVSESGSLEQPFFEVPLDALRVHQYMPGKTEALPEITPDPIPDQYTNTENIWHWVSPRFCLTVMGQDGTQLVKLFETDSGLLDVEWSDPPKHTEAAHRFIEGVIQIWNSLR